LKIIVTVENVVRGNYNIFFIFAHEKDVALRIILIKHYGISRLNIILIIWKNRQRFSILRQKQQMGFHGVD